MKQVGFGEQVLPRLLLLACAQFLFGFCSLAVVALLSGMALDLNESLEGLAWLVAHFSLAFAIGAIVGPSWSRSRAPRTVLVVGLLGLTMGALALALAPTVSWASLARWIQGLSAALIGPTTSVFAIALAPRELRGRALGMVFGGTMVAIVLGLPLASWLSERIPWRWIFGLVALASLVLALAVCLWLPRALKSTGGKEAQEDMLRTALQPAVGFALLTALLRMTAQFACYTLIGMLAVIHFGLPTSAVAAVLLAYGVSGLVGNQAAGYWVDRYGVASVLRWCGIAVVASYAGLALLSADSAVALIWIAILCWGFASVMFATPQQVFLAELPAPSAGSVALSLNAAASYAGMALGSGAASLIAVGFGLGALVGFSLLLSLLSIVTSEISLWFSRRHPSAVRD